MNKMKKMTRRRSDYPDENFEKIHSSKWNNNLSDENENTRRRQRVMVDTHNFKCAQCGASVIASRAESGVNNRNHCPHCLWSLHVDEKVAGDRKATCRSRMEPVGITTKQTSSRYNQSNAGELMVIHRCRGCGKLSINRIAADDDPVEIYRIYQVSLTMTPEERQGLLNAGINALSAGDLTTVYSQLYGWQSIIEEFTSSSTRTSEIVVDRKPMEELNVEK